MVPLSQEKRGPIVSGPRVFADHPVTQIQACLAGGMANRTAQSQCPCAGPTGLPSEPQETPNPKMLGAAALAQDPWSLEGDPEAWWGPLLGWSTWRSLHHTKMLPSSTLLVTVIHVPCDDFSHGISSARGVSVLVSRGQGTPGASVWGQA